MKTVVTFLLVAGLALAVAAPATAALPGNDPTIDAKEAAAWLAGQVNASGFIPVAPNSPTANLSVSAQAVTALAAAGVGKAQVNALLGYLGNHVEEFVAGGSGDDPGHLAYLILAAEAGGLDPTSFGVAHADLVARLVATQRTTGTTAGLFGAADATFDGAFRQGLALLALHAAGVVNAAGVTWLEGQQCADGSWMPFRADTAVACPAVDPIAFTGPDTNSTALAILGLHAQGATTQVAAGVAALDAVRTPGGGWGFFASSGQTADSNSTADVLQALRTVNGAADAPGIAALLTFQVGCRGAVADRGGIMFQPGSVPDTMSAVQAIPALAEAPLPITSAAISAGVPTVCASTSTSTTTSSTTLAASGSTVPGTVATLPATATTVAADATGELPRTGGSSTAIAVFAVCVLGLGTLLAGARRRRT